MINSENAHFESHIIESKVYTTYNNFLNINNYFNNKGISNITISNWNINQKMLDSLREWIGTEEFIKIFLQFLSKFENPFC